MNQKTPAPKREGHKHRDGPKTENLRDEIGDDGAGPA
jgi:hypothetical protein